MNIVYGPVPSWRLGRSLGIDPLGGQMKRCTFDCAYCQLGPTRRPTLQRDAWVRPTDLAQELRAVADMGTDYVTFSGMGEPTLAANLPELIRVARETQPARLAILTNASLLPDPEVRAALAELDFVIAKLDAPSETALQAINRPGVPISLCDILHAIHSFRRDFRGMFALEVMLTPANLDDVDALADIARCLDPDEVQLNTPLRPSPTAPLPPSALSAAARAFFGLSLVCVYEACHPQVSPFEAASTARRRPERANNHATSGESAPPARRAATTTGPQWS